MMTDTDALDGLYQMRLDEYGQDPKFAALFATKWLPASGVEQSLTPAHASLFAPLYPEVYVFGPRIHTALNCVANTLRILEGADRDRVAAFAADLGRTYLDEFGDIHDYDWDIYRRYMTRNRLTFTSRIDRVYDVLHVSTPAAMISDNPTRVEFTVMLQEMLYFELLGPGMQGLKTDNLHRGAKRHAACVTKWSLRQPIS